MKNHGYKSQKASVLIIAMLTITIMTLICATSLFIIGQNAGSGAQTAGWQQALTASESGVDMAIRALNATATGSGAPWTNWKQVTATLPTSGPGYSSEPSGGSSSFSTAPSTSQYNYLPSSAFPMTLSNTEGATSTSFWVTIDTASGTSLNPTGSSQWYRIRSTGQTKYPTNSSLTRRRSNNRLDNELRNSIALITNRTNTFSQPTITRTVEVIVQPQGGSTTVSPWGGKGLYLTNALTMSGGGVMGHYNSGSVLTSTFVTSPATYRSTDYTETLIGMMNANGSDLKSTYVYGGIAYSTTGSAPQNTNHVQGSITTPFTASPPSPTDPTWTPDISYTGGGNPPFSTIGPTNASYNSASHPYRVKINGDFTVPGGKSVTITSPNSGATTTYIEFWITGKFTTSGSGFITQANGVHVAYYVDSSITTSGQSVQNLSGFAGNTQFFAVGGGSVTVSGSGNFIGTVEAPTSTITVSGSSLLIGSLIGKTMDISGGASYYYDDALTNWTGGSGNYVTAGTTTGYAFASWFEDNADPTRSARDVTNSLNSIVY